MKLLTDSYKCSGCRICELICSYWHEGVFNPAMSRIRVEVNRAISQLSDGSDIDIPHVCRQCQPAPCAEACPADAFRFCQETRIWEIDTDACIGCQECAEACQFDMIIINAGADLSAEKCDLCHGNPQCVSACPCQALSVSSP